MQSYSRAGSVHISEQNGFLLATQQLVVNEILRENVMVLKFEWCILKEQLNIY
jgi:hypothetical protein